MPRNHRTYKDPAGDGTSKPPNQGAPRGMPRRNQGAGWGWIKTVAAIGGTAALTAAVTYWVTEALNRRKESKEERSPSSSPPVGTVVPAPVPMWGPPPQMYLPAAPPALPPPVQHQDRPLTQYELLELARIRQRERETELRERELDNERMFLEGIG